MQQLCLSLHDQLLGGHCVSAGGFEGEGSPQD
jgi:hypothetical protein